MLLLLPSQMELEGGGGGRRCFLSANALFFFLSFFYFIFFFFGEPCSLDLTIKDRGGEESEQQLLSSEGS